jgi:hypothetical protein
VIVLVVCGLVCVIGLKVVCGLSCVISLKVVCGEV